MFQDAESNVWLRPRILLLLLLIELSFDVLHDDYPYQGKIFAVQRWVHLPANHTLLVDSQRFDAFPIESAYEEEDGHV